MALDFVQKLHKAQSNYNTKVALVLRPSTVNMPAPMHWHDDPFFPFSKAIIQATRDIVCGYVFDFAFYLAHGAAGVVALERAMAYVPDDLVKILHGPFLGKQYVGAVFEDAFYADAVTIVDPNEYHFFSQQAHHEAFVCCKSDECESLSGFPVYRLQDGVMMLSDFQGLIRLSPDEVLYADFGDDFAIKCRKALLSWGGRLLWN